MKKLEILLTDKQHNLLERIAQADDRRLSDLIPLLFSTGLNYYFDEKNIYVEKKDNEFTYEEKKQNKINKELEINNPGFWGLSNDKRKKLGYKFVETFYSNYHSQQKNFISELSKDLKEYALQQIKQDFKEIEENTIKENIPGQLVKTFISPIDNCKFDYFIFNNILSYRIEGTSNWQDFIPNNRDFSEKQNKEFNQLLEEVKNND